MRASSLRTTTTPRRRRSSDCKRRKLITDNTTNPQVIGFWHEYDPLGCLFNWHPSGFDFRGTHFATNEH